MQQKHHYNDKPTLEFFRGKSFRFLKKWKPNTHYVCDEWYIDFVVYRGCLLACAESHLSEPGLPPELQIGKNGLAVASLSPEWTLVLAGLESADTETLLESLLNRLTVNDTETNNYYVSSVSQQNGKINLAKKRLPIIGINETNLLSLSDGMLNAHVKFNYDSTSRSLQLLGHNDHVLTEMVVPLTWVEYD